MSTKQPLSTDNPTLTAGAAQNSPGLNHSGLRGCLGLGLGLGLVGLLSVGCAASGPGAAAAASETSGSAAGSGSGSASNLTIEVITSSEQAGAVNSTLLVGDTEVVIVDAQFTKSAAEMLADRAAATGKSVKRILITHAHPDHYLGTAVLHARFKDAKFIASPSVVAEMRATAADTAAARAEFLGPEFPGAPIIPEVYASDELTIDGVSVELLASLSGDTHPITALFIPSAGTLIASDVGYADIHLWTATTDHAGRLAWAAETDTLSMLPGLRRALGKGDRSAVQTSGRCFVRKGRARGEHAKANGR